MDVKAIPALVVGVMVAIAVFGAVLPIFVDASDDTKTIFNNDYNRYSQRLDTDINDFTMSITWAVTATTAYVTIGDNPTYNYSMSSTRTPLIYTENGMFNANKANSRGVLNYIDSSSAINITASPITIEVAGGVVTVTDSADTPNVYTWDVGDWLFYPDNNGNYTAMNTTTDKDTEIYLNSIDDLYFATVINTDSLGYVSGHGDKCTFYSQDGTPSYAMNLTYSELDGYTNVITSTIGSYTISEDAGTNSDDSPFCPFITMVPRVIEGHTPINGAISVLIQALPVIIGAGLVLSVVTWFIVRKG